MLLVIDQSLVLLPLFVGGSVCGPCVVIHTLCPFSLQLS